MPIERGGLPETCERAHPESAADDLPEAGPTEPPRIGSEPVRQTDGDGGFTVACGARTYRLMGLEKSPRRLKVTVRVERVGRIHVDTLDLYSSRSRKILAGDLCLLFDETPESIEADIAKLIKRCESARLNPEADAATSAAVVTPRDRAEAETFGRAPDLIDRLLADSEMLGLIGEESNKILGYVAMTSRKRDDPLSVLILSSSGAGKTALQDTVLSFCPPEDLVKLTALSGKALFYKERLSLKHKVLALEEGDGAEEASYAIRNLISSGELVSESTIKDLATGRLITMENRVEGPTPVFLTTTKPDLDAETKSRFWVTSIDESREQTRRILAFQRRRHFSDGPAERAAREAILKRHHNFQRLLKPLAVKNPYAGQLAYGDDRLQGRRDQPKYLNLIKAIAFLRQMRKEIKIEGNNGTATDLSRRSSEGTKTEYIEVDLEDIALANRLAHEILGHSLDELSRPSRALLLELERMVRERVKKDEAEESQQLDRVAFTRREIRRHTGWSNYRVHTHLRELIEYEYVSVEIDRTTNGHRYRLLYEGQGKDGERFLLGLSDVEGLRLTDPGAPSR